MLDPTQWNDLLHMPEFGLGLALGVLFGLLLAFLVRLSRRTHPETVAAFRNDAGQVLVSRRALEEQLQALCEEPREVVRARVQVKRRNDILSVAINLKLRADCHLTGVSNELQEHTRSFLKENLGIEEIGAIDIVVDRIVPGAADRVKSTTLTPGERRPGE